MISEDGQKFLEALHDYLVPMIGPAATGIVGFALGRNKDRAEATKLEAEADTMAIDGITRSFQTLIDGYEKRIEDLTKEVTALRLEVRELRQALDKST